MVISIVFFNGHELKRTIYRGVIKQKQIAEFREGFYAQRALYQCGGMWELKGTNSTLLAKFGDINKILELKGLED